MHGNEKVPFRRKVLNEKVLFRIKKEQKYQIELMIFNK